MASGKQVGGTVGGLGGAAAGTYFGGPVGGAVGGFVGSKLGSAIGGLFGGDDNNGPSDETMNNLRGDANTSRATSADFLQAYKDAGKAGAPMMGAATTGPAAQTNVPTVGATTVRNVQQVRGVEQLPAFEVQRTGVGPAANATGVLLAPTQLAGGTAVRPANTVDPTGINLGPAQVAGAAMTGPAAQADAAKVDTTKSDQFRGDQSFLTGNLRDTIEGKGPSVAREQLRQTTESNIANARGNAVAASRGGNVALALRTLMRAQGDINQQAAGQGALVRAQEIATARGQLGDAASSARGQDIGVETADAQMQQQANLQNAAEKNKLATTNAELGTQTNIASMQALNAMKQRAEELKLQAAQGNQQAINDLAKVQAQLDAAQASGNADRLNTAATTQAQLDAANHEANAGRVQQTTLTQAQIDAAKATADAAARNTVNDANANRLQQAGVVNANNDTTLSTTQAGVDSSRNLTQAGVARDVGISNTTQTNTLADHNADREQDAGKTNVNAAITTNGQNIQDRAAAGNLVLGSQQNTLAADKTVGGFEVGTKAADNAQDAATMNTVTQIAGVAAQAYGAGAAGYTSGTSTAPKSGDDVYRPPTSDKRAKKNIKADSSGPYRQLLDAIRPDGFDYKEPEGHGSGRAPGRQHGVMAQDLERGGPIGKSLVFTGDDGLKRIDGPQTFGVVLALAKHLSDRLDRVEGRARR